MAEFEKKIDFALKNGCFFDTNLRVFIQSKISNVIVQ